MKLFICILGIFFASNLAAQGIHFSDNREMPMQLNPAFTGIIHNNYIHRLLVAHRRQGNAILGKSEFETSYLSYDRKLGLCRGENAMFIGIGLELLHDQVGVSIGKDAQFYHRQEVNINASLGVRLNDASYLVAGLRTGLLSHGLSDENLTFDSQFDGRNFDDRLSTLEEFSTERLFYFDIGAGLLLRGAINNNVLKTYEVGISFMHLNNKKKKFLLNSIQEELGKEYRVHGKVDFVFNRKFRISPSFILYKYGALIGENGKEWQVRPSVEFPLLKNWIPTVGMRISNFANRGSNLDALVMSLKWKPYAGMGGTNNKKDNMIVGISLDLNVSPHLVNASRGFGAFEVFLTRYFTGSKNRSPCCPWSNTKNQVFY